MRNLVFLEKQLVGIIYPQIVFFSHFMAEIIDRDCHFKAMNKEIAIL